LLVSLLLMRVLLLLKWFRMQMVLSLFPKENKFVRRKFLGGN